MIRILTLFLLPFTLLFSSCNTSKLEKKLAIEYKSIDNPDDITPFEDSLIWPVIYENAVPLNGLTVEGKKQKFIEMILPSILVIRHIYEEKIRKLDEIKHRIEHNLPIEIMDSVFLAKKLIEYKAKNIEELRMKLIPPPASLILAQAAIESGWGGSRFMVEANNIFGVWSTSSTEKRIKSLGHRDGNYIYLRRYEFLSASIHDYYRLLGRSNAYVKFREKKALSSNPYELINYLKKYSESDEYLDKLKIVIRKNNLTKYDSYQLHPLAFVEVETMPDKPKQKLVNMLVAEAFPIR